MIYAFNGRSKLYIARQKLKKLNNPWIEVSDNVIMIDTWCDGNENESAKVITITTAYRRLIDNIIQSESS
jgi:hypothetical protein